MRTYASRMENAVTSAAHDMAARFNANVSCASTTRNARPARTNPPLYGSMTAAIRASG